VTYRSPWWCPNGHLQTVWGPLLRQGPRALRRERVETPDGDFVDLDWLDGSARTPLLLVLHGLEGSVRSHYVAGLLNEAAARGWRGLVLNFRSCSGDLNRLPRFYHSGDTGDLHHVVEMLREREPDLRLGAVGISIGGNVLLKWLGEQEVEAPKQLVGAVAISVPFDLRASARVLDRGFARAVYTANFLKTMKRKARDKAARYPGFVDLAAVGRARTFAQYDRVVTAPLHGFKDEIDYWTRASSGPYLARIRRPTLLISALDDPLVPTASLPDPRTLPACVQTEFSPRGGHVGFLEGRWPWRVRSWAERRAVEFLSSVLT
jgi:predicted alpha/beta-fold hydrolase